MDEDKSGNITCWKCKSTYATDNVDTAICPFCKTPASEAPRVTKGGE